jgi:hypothetical protein
MNYKYILLGVGLLLFTILLIYYFWGSSSNTCNQKKNLKKGITTVPVTNTTGSKYSYEVWVFANSFPTETDICYNVFSVDKSISVDIQPNGSLQVTAFANSSTTNQIQVTRSFPLNKWTYIGISVDATLIDLYLDGKIEKSIVNPNPINNPASNLSNNVVFGNPSSNGSSPDLIIYGFRMNNTSLTPDKSMKNYRGGRSYIQTTKPGLSFQLDKNGVLAKNFILF